MNSSASLIAYARFEAVLSQPSAMFSYANGTRDEMKAMFKDMAGDRLEVVLGQRDHAIYFIQTHRRDLLAVIEASQLRLGQSATEPE